MAQDLVEDKRKWQWIQLRQTIAPTDWNYKKVLHSQHNEWGFETKIEFKPKLKKENCVWKYGCRYFHKMICLQFFLSSSNKTDYVDLRLCYIPKSSEKRDIYLNADDRCHVWAQSESPYDQRYRSYVWKPDISLVKMIFRSGGDESKSITKNIHLDPESGNCKSEDHTSLVWDELTHYRKKDFLSKSDLEDTLGYTMECGKHSFLSVDIEFRARLNLSPLLQDFYSVESDEDCFLASSKIQLMLPFDLTLSAPSTNPFDPMGESRLKCVNMAPDVAVVTKEIPLRSHNVHSWVLAVQSPVFRQMFSTDMLEKKNKVIKLSEDTTAETLQLFLTCLYKSMGLSYSKTPEAENRSLDEWGADLSLKILQLAHKYQVKDLTHFCFENIISRPDSEFTVELVMDIFQAGMLYENSDLQNRAVEWAKRQTKEVKIELIEFLKQESEVLVNHFLQSLF